MINIKTDKRAISIPIYLLVIMSLTLIIFTLFNFASKQTDVEKRINIPDAVDAVYLNEKQAYFYLKEVFDKTSENFQPSMGKTAFINSFNQELGKNQGNINEIKEENVELSKDRLFLKIDFQTSSLSNLNGKEIINVNYKKIISFEKKY